MVLVGIEDSDTPEDISWLTSKLWIFIFGWWKWSDESVKDIDGDIIVVSQFTLHALTKKGNRPSYIKLQSQK
jgi:D-tyrosyl-tRNA(Tyr) deacylase